MDRTDIHEGDLMRMRRMAGLLFAGGLAAGLGASLTATAHASALCMTAGNLDDNDQTPLVAARCQGFGNAAEILELG
jgi:hypothetical protein